VAVLLVVCAPASAATGATSHSFDVATGVLTSKVSPAISGDRVELSTIENSLPEGCVGCPSEWDSVQRWVIESSAPLDFVFGSRKFAIRGGDEVKVEIVVPKSSGADVTMDVTDTDLYGNRALTEAVRFRAVGRGLDINGDGDVDIAVTAGDWLPVLTGGPGNDQIDLSRATGLWRDGSPIVDGPTIDGGFGNDRLVGSYLGDHITGGPGRDTILGGPGNDEIAGDGGSSDKGQAADVLRGGPGNDLLEGYDGNDKIYGDNGNDYLMGAGGNDVLIGGRGKDHLHGWKGRDRMYGGPGNDTIWDHHGRSLAVGGSGNDYINFGTLSGPWGPAARTSRAVCGAGNDRLGDAYPRRSRCERTNLGPL
jgi:hypothetical protein